MTWRDWVVLVARLLVAGVFLYAAYAKLDHPPQFARAIYNYHILPAGPLVYVPAVTLPFVELFAALMLVTGVRLRAAAALVLLMAVIFVAAMLSAVVRGLDIDCGCYSGNDPVGWWSIARTSGLALLALVVLCLGPDRFCADRRLRGSRTDAAPPDDPSLHD